MAINIKGVSKAKVLAALFNNSRPSGMGFYQPHATVMTEAEAAELFKHGSYFDYVRGRVLKVDLSGDSFDERLYDRDMGDGAAWEAVRSLLQDEATPEGGAQ